MGIEKANFIGHSQGCLVGIDFASKYPNLVDKLVLVSGSYKLPVNQDLLDLAFNGDEKSIHLMMKWQKYIEFQHLCLLRQNFH